MWRNARHAYANAVSISQSPGHVATAYSSDSSANWACPGRAALEYLKASGRAPHVVHLHEWQAAAAAMLFWELYSPALPAARMALTLHNMDSTGECSQEEFGFTGEPAAACDGRKCRLQPL